MGENALNSRHIIVGGKINCISKFTIFTWSSGFAWNQTQSQIPAYIDNIENKFMIENRKIRKKKKRIILKKRIAGLVLINLNMYCITCIHIWNFWHLLYTINILYIYIYTERFISYRKYMLQITQPFQYSTQLQYRFAVIFEAPSKASITY